MTDENEMKEAVFLGIRPDGNYRVACPYCSKHFAFPTDTMYDTFVCSTCRKEFILPEVIVEEVDSVNDMTDSIVVQKNALSSRKQVPSCVLPKAEEPQPSVTQTVSSIVVPDDIDDVPTRDCEDGEKGIRSLIAFLRNNKGLAWLVIAAVAFVVVVLIAATVMFLSHRSTNAGEEVQQSNEIATPVNEYVEEPESEPKTEIDEPIVVEKEGDTVEDDVPEKENKVETVLPASQDAVVVETARKAQEQLALQRKKIAQEYDNKVNKLLADAKYVSATDADKLDFIKRVMEEMQLCFEQRQATFDKIFDDAVKIVSAMGIYAPIEAPAAFSLKQFDLREDVKAIESAYKIELDAAKKNMEKKVPLYVTGNEIPCMINGHRTTAEYQSYDSELGVVKVKRWGRELVVNIDNVLDGLKPCNLDREMNFKERGRILREEIAEKSQIKEEQLEVIRQDELKRIEALNRSKGYIQINNKWVSPKQLLENWRRKLTK